MCLRRKIRELEGKEIFPLLRCMGLWIIDTNRKIGRDIEMGTCGRSYSIAHSVWATKLREELYATSRTKQYVSSQHKQRYFDGFQSIQYYHHFWQPDTLSRPCGLYDSISPRYINHSLGTNDRRLPLPSWNPLLRCHQSFRLLQRLISTSGAHNQ